MADAVYDALRPFHLWAQVTAACAVVLALAAVLVLAVSRRGSRRWWLGMGIVTVCLLTVAFGERSRSAAGDLRSVATCYSQWVSGCEQWTPWLVEATRRVALLGALLFVATVLGALVATVVIVREKGAIRTWKGRPPVHAFTLALAVPLAALGAFLTADGVAAWLQYAYLADITRAGDGLGQIPLLEGISGTVLGAVVLAAGIGWVVAASRAPQRHEGHI